MDAVSTPNLKTIARCLTELGSGISEFIDDYVFPGAELVHAAGVIESLARSELECLDAENLRPHYARTLWQWVSRLEAHSSEARRLIGEQTYRSGPTRLNSSLSFLSGFSADSHAASLTVGSITA